MQDELRWVADSIRTLRKAKGMTQEQLAKKRRYQHHSSQKLKRTYELLG